MLLSLLVARVPSYVVSELLHARWTVGLQRERVKRQESEEDASPGNKSPQGPLAAVEPPTFRTTDGPEREAHGRRSTPPSLSMPEGDFCTNLHLGISRHLREHAVAAESLAVSGLAASLRLGRGGG